MPRQDVLNKSQAQNGIVELPPNSNNTAYGFWYQLSFKWAKMVCHVRELGGSSCGTSIRTHSNQQRHSPLPGGT